jgi:hypothetical protein
VETAKTKLTLVSVPLSRLVNSAQGVSGPPSRNLLTVVDDALAKDAAMVEDAALTSHSLAD